MRSICLISLLSLGICAASTIYQLDDGYSSDSLNGNQEWSNFTKKLSKAVVEDATLRFVPLAEKYGYPVENYYVETKDGYILNLHRIPHGRNGPPKRQRGVVFVMHGILSSSIDWLISGPDKGIGYLLADEGYDVWLGNARGNYYSRNHTILDPEEKDFWDFSWHEIGTIDLPTMIDFTLEKTGAKNVFYISHSQGTTTFYVMTSEMPEYNAKIRAQFSLAPIAYVNHMTSPLFQLLSKAGKSLGTILELIGMHEFLPKDGFLHNIAKSFCEKGILQSLCTNSLFAMTGFNEKQMNMTLLPILVSHTPAGSSTKQFLHYAQLINSGGFFHKGTFRQFDYGFFKNKKYYGQHTPPSYNLKKVTAPVYLFYSKNDWLSAAMDVHRLYGELGNAQALYPNPDESFNHIDYVFGIDAPKLIYSKVFSLMLRH